MTLFVCNDGLIGDFLGVIPAMIELSKRDELHVKIHPEANHIFNLIPKKYNIKLIDTSINYKEIIELDILKSYTLSKQYNYYMSQANFVCLNLPVPSIAPKAELEFEVTDEPCYDYIIAPFSRSLPPEQLWPQINWQRLVDLMPASSFCIIGHARDTKNFIKGSNVTGMYNEPLVKVMNVFKNVQRGLISVVSGPSHLAFHLNIKNYLLTNQSETWGNNPDAVKITEYIPELKPEKLIDVLNNF